MFCLIALIIFSILGTFSATHRALARQAFDCVFRRITFRPCNADFKEKAKGKLVGKLLERSVLAARIFNKHFELISWLLFILTVGSLLWAMWGGYNFYLYGSCNGLNQSGFCAFDPSGENNKISQFNASCSLEEASEKDLTLNGVDLSSFPKKDPGSGNELIFIGCYSCDYTRKVYPVIKELLSEKSVNYIFMHYPIKDKTEFLSELGYCAYKQDKDKFWELNDSLFAADKEKLNDRNYTDSLVLNFGFDAKEMEKCLNSKETKSAVGKQILEIQKTNIYGTPTIFINGQVLVGPKPYRVYERVLQ